jgi:hypothetical protein
MFAPLLWAVVALAADLPDHWIREGYTASGRPTLYALGDQPVRWAEVRARLEADPISAPYVRRSVSPALAGPAIWLGGLWVAAESTRLDPVRLEGEPPRGTFRSPVAAYGAALGGTALQLAGIVTWAPPYRRARPAIDIYNARGPVPRGWAYRYPRGSRLHGPEIAGAVLIALGTATELGVASARLAGETDVPLGGAIAIGGVFQVLGASQFFGPWSERRKLIDAHNAALLSD